MPILTVILLTYNHAGTVEAALNSILMQETEYEFDVHVLDDCSSDGTSEICSQYQSRYPEKVVHCRNELNKGVTRNFKEGVMRVDSKYLAFLEGDDVWTSPKKLQMQIDKLEAHPECNLCGHNVAMYDHVTDEKSVFVNIRKADVKEVYYLSDDIYIHPSSRVYRNVIDFSKVPDFMVLDTHIYRLFLMSGQCCYIDQVMSLYNKTGTGYWTGMCKKDKKIMTLKLRYASLKYYDFQHVSEFYSRKRSLRVLKFFFGVRLGWKLFYRLEMARLKVKYARRR